MSGLAPVGSLGLLPGRVCLEEWLASHEQLPLTIIVPIGSDATAFEELASKSPDRVRVVSLPPAEAGSPVAGP